MAAALGLATSASAKTVFVPPVRPTAVRPTAVRPTAVRVERLLAKDAYGIDVPDPTISWDLTTPDTAPDGLPPIRHVFVAVHLDPAAVARSAQRFARGEAGPRLGAAAFESTAPVPAGQQHLVFAGIRYAGPALRSSRRYHVAVCVRFGLAGPAACNLEPVSFVTGKVVLRRGDPAPWSGKWIGGASDLVPKGCSRCMASYHSWCQNYPPGKGAGRCGMRGVLMRSGSVTATTTDAAGADGGAWKRSALASAVVYGNFDFV